VSPYTLPLNQNPIIAWYQLLRLPAAAAPFFPFLLGAEQRVQQRLSELVILRKNKPSLDNLSCSK
jgi:hypothetical protein